MADGSSSAQHAPRSPPAALQQSAALAARWGPLSAACASPHLVATSRCGSAMMGYSMRCPSDMLPSMSFTHLRRVAVLKGQVGQAEEGPAAGLWPQAALCMTGPVVVCCAGKTPQAGRLLLLKCTQSSAEKCGLAGPKAGGRRKGGQVSGVRVGLSHCLCDSSGLHDRAASCTPRLANSPCSLAAAPSSLVQTCEWGGR